MILHNDGYCTDYTTDQSVVLVCLIINRMFVMIDIQRRCQMTIHSDGVCTLILALKPGLHFERKSTAYTQTILRTWGAFSRPPMPIYALGIGHVPSVNTPTIRRLLRVDAGLSLANSPQPMRIRKLLRDI